MSAAVGVEKFLALGRSGFAATLCVVLLPQCANALPSASAGQTAPNGVMPNGLYNPGLALAPGFAPPVDNVGMTISAWNTYGAAPSYRSLPYTTTPDNDSASPSFDNSDYAAMWDDTKFSEIAAYGGLARDALRVAGMRAMGGAESDAIPYGRLTLQRDFQDDQQQLVLGAYGTQASVRQTAISDFGDDSYTDVAVDATWRWVVHPERTGSNAFAAHVLILHEDENLMASHAIFGTNKNDSLTMFRGGASWSWGGNVVPGVQYFQMTGSPDPIRLGTLTGSPDSKGFVGEIDYVPTDDARSPLNWFNARLSLQFVAYSEFDGLNRDASQNNTVLFHLTASTN